jgi:hypothetical protein
VRRQKETRRETAILIALGAMIFLFGSSMPSEGQERATAQEVVQKVQDAAKILSQSGEAGLAQFDKKESPWVWKDTDVFVFDCAKGTIAAHPFRPDLIGKDDTKLRGTRGTEFFPKLCEATKSPSGVWVEYWWPKPGEKEGSRKVSYALTVSNTPYIVGAGIYDDKATIIELQKFSSPGK